MKEDDNTTDLHRGVHWISTYTLYRIVSGRYVCSTVLLFTLVTSNFFLFLEFQLFFYFYVLFRHNSKYMSYMYMDMSCACHLRGQ